MHAYFRVSSKNRYVVPVSVLIPSFIQKAMMYFSEFVVSCSD